MALGKPHERADGGRVAPAGNRHQRDGGCDFRLHQGPGGDAGEEGKKLWHDGAAHPGQDHRLYPVLARGPVLIHSCCHRHAIESAMTLLGIELKRAYEAPSDRDGLRVLVERLWPRGLTKAEAAIDHWMKDIAPTPELRTWYGHRPDRWPEFRRRYRAELKGNQAAVESLRALCAGQQVTFVFAAKDEERNSAIVLKELLLAG